MAGGRPSKGKQQRYPELQELASWFHRALTDRLSLTMILLGASLKAAPGVRLLARHPGRWPFRNIGL
jgi:hypothetical protein